MGRHIVGRKRYRGGGSNLAVPGYAQHAHRSLLIAIHVSDRLGHDSVVVEDVLADVSVAVVVVDDVAVVVAVASPPPGTRMNTTVTTTCFAANLSFRAR